MPENPEPEDDKKEYTAELMLGNQQWQLDKLVKRWQEDMSNPDREEVNKALVAWNDALQVVATWKRIPEEDRETITELVKRAWRTPQ